MKHKVEQKSITLWQMNIPRTFKNNICLGRPWWKKLNQFCCCREVKFCDVTSPQVFLKNEDQFGDGADLEVGDNVDIEFDVVITSLVFDVVALNNQDFETFLTNVAKIIKPGNNWMKNQLFIYIFFRAHDVLIIILLIRK